MTEHAATTQLGVFVQPIHSLNKQLLITSIVITHIGPRCLQDEKKMRYITGVDLSPLICRFEAAQASPELMEGTGTPSFCDTRREEIRDPRETPDCLTGDRLVQACEGAEGLSLVSPGTRRGWTSNVLDMFRAQAQECWQTISQDTAFF